MDLPASVIDVAIAPDAKNEESDCPKELKVCVTLLSWPNTLDADNVAADYTAGVLTLRIPVREEAKPRKVTISSKDPPAITAG
jgi:hypothetical protein